MDLRLLVRELLCHTANIWLKLLGSVEGTTSSGVMVGALRCSSHVHQVLLRVALRVQH